MQIFTGELHTVVFSGRNQQSHTTLPLFICGTTIVGAKEFRESKRQFFLTVFLHAFLMILWGM